MSALLIAVVRTNRFMPFLEACVEVIRKQKYRGFEQGSPIPFPTTLSAPYELSNISI